MTDPTDSEDSYPPEWRLDMDLPADDRDPWAAGAAPWRVTGRDQEQRAYAAVASWLRRETHSPVVVMDYVNGLPGAAPDSDSVLALSAVIGILDAVTQGLRSIGAEQRVAQILAAGPAPIPLDDGDGHDDTVK